MVATDWAAKLLGLDETFHGASGVGGGIILVSSGNDAGGWRVLIDQFYLNFRALHLNPASQSPSQPASGV